MTPEEKMKLVEKLAKILCEDMRDRKGFPCDDGDIYDCDSDGGCFFCKEMAENLVEHGVQMS